VCTLLTVATMGGVLACLLRHFRASLASLPLLGQPLGRLPVRDKYKHLAQICVLRHFRASAAAAQAPRTPASE